jgi:hypothetical protein
VRQRRALAVARRHDGGGRAEGGRGAEEDLHLAYAYRRGAAGDEVCLGQAEVVYAFCCDVGGAEDEFEAVG